MSDKMWEEFTEWAAKTFEIPASLIKWTDEQWEEGYPVRVINERGEQSEEANSLFGIAWLAFQASRAALAVELPYSYKDAPPYACYEGGWNDMRGEVVDALAEAGVTVK